MDTKRKVRKGQRIYVTNTKVLSRKLQISQKNPIRIQKCYLSKVIEKLNKKKSKTKEKHQLIEDYGASGEMALQLCQLPSVEAVLNDGSLKNGSLKNISPCTSSTLFHLLRECMMSHNWPYCLKLFSELLNFKNLTKRHLIYIFRLLIITMLNSRISSDELDEVISVTLGVKDEDLKKDFLKSLFKLPMKLKLGERIEKRKKRQEYENNLKKKKTQK